MDDNFHSYLNRVAKLTLPDTYSSSINHLQESPKFEATAQGRVPASFPGYSIISPPAPLDGDNQDFYGALQTCQQQMVKNLPPDLVALVDPASFHVTLADLVWDNSYLALTSNDAHFEENLRAQIALGFQNHVAPTDTPTRWQLMGLMLRPRAIAVSLIPADEESYERIVAFRRSVYQNPGLIALGVEQQYHFTAHITLAYFGNVQQEFDRQAFSEMLQDLNLQWLDRPPLMTISKGELRKFTDMTHYLREADWPVVTV